MKIASVPPSGTSLAFWLALFAVCSGLLWGSPVVLFAGLATPVVALAAWALRSL